TGARIDRIGRRAKYLLMTLETGVTLIGHLGMSGSFRIEKTPDPALILDPHDHVIFETMRGARVRYHDPRRFGFMLLTTEEALPVHPQIKDIGPEPLGNEFNGPLLASRLEGRKSPVKTALLDQKVVAGVGNIYASEALHRSGISPKRLAANVGPVRAERLATAIREVLEEAILSGGSTLRNYSRTDGELGYFQHRFQVYDKEGNPCPTPGCGGTVKRIVQGARATFYCPACQR
ncbi:MAG: bifunctional DNA-formamidopyrimidine glycosylase/DNA-(apurinic or apyrimidinic site) lyase, partial [Alphaproteobacteria bacterium]